jgi:hypothetical protein
MRMDKELKFIQVGELAKGITENILPASNDLAGSSSRLYFEDGTEAQVDFIDDHNLTWQMPTNGKETCDPSEAIYRATSPRDGIFLVDFIDNRERAQTVSLVIDRNTQCATAVIGTLPTPKETGLDAFSRVQKDMELTSVSARFLRATIDRPFSPVSHPHGPTDELVGKRIKYVYSQTEAYEHIYLNSNLYTWHCLAGIEKGLADTDCCHYYKIDEQLYLFVWREKIVPTLGLVLVDLDRLKTTGKLFGYEGTDFNTLTNAPIGAYATLLNETRHP